MTNPETSSDLVKRLEFGAAQHPKRLQAVSIVGTYIVTRRGSKYSLMRHSDEFGHALGLFDFPEAATSVAQADYTARILSAIDATTIERLTAERDELRARLFPYADDKQISGMSWGGFYLIGNDKSIKELRRIEHRAAQLEEFRAAFDERIAAAESLNARQAEALKRIAELRFVEDANEPFDDALDIADAALATESSNG